MRPREACCDGFALSCAPAVELEQGCFPARGSAVAEASARAIRGDCRDAGGDEQLRFRVMPNV